MAYWRRFVILIAEFWAYSVTRFCPLKTHVHYWRCWIEKYFSWGLDYFYESFGHRYHLIVVQILFNAFRMCCVVFVTQKFMMRIDNFWEFIKKMAFIYLIILENYKFKVPINNSKIPINILKFQFQWNTWILTRSHVLVNKCQFSLIFIQILEFLIRHLE